MRSRFTLVFDPKKCSGTVARCALIVHLSSINILHAQARPDPTSVTWTGWKLNRSLNATGRGGSRGSSGVDSRYT